jgi:hypothetical protein
MAGVKGMKRRTKDQVEAVREAAREELAAGHPMTLRQVHYRLVSRDDVVHPNTQSAYDTLSGWLRDDRLSGAVEWEWMEDRLREPHDIQMWHGLAITSRRFGTRIGVRCGIGSLAMSRCGAKRMHSRVSSPRRSTATV